MKKFTKEERILFKGKPNGSPTIEKDKIIAPNLFKMSAKELQKWKNKVSNTLSNYCHSITRSSAHTEYNRINHFINCSIKTITLTDKDFIDFIKEKRRIGKNIVIDGVSIVCRQKGPGHKIEVEYYAD